MLVRNVILKGEERVAESSGRFRSSSNKLDITIVRNVILKRRCKAKDLPRTCRTWRVRFWQIRTRSLTLPSSEVTLTVRPTKRTHSAVAEQPDSPTETSSMGSRPWLGPQNLCGTLGPCLGTRDDPGAPSWFAPLTYNLIAELSSTVRRANAEMS
jgi:hypothetical protein